MEFVLQECQKKQIKEVCDQFNNDEGELINVLHTTQGIFGYLPEAVQREIATDMNVPVARIYGIVSFYSFFTMKPKGKHAISICLGTACYVRGSENILEEVEKELNIKVGGITEDGLFSLDCLRCVGACGLAPVMLVGDKVYGRVEASKVKEILAEYK